MKRATQEQAHQFSAEMSRRYHATIIHKQAAVEMQAVAMTLEVMRRFGQNVPSADEFLNNFATTVGTLIYLPNGWSPDDQIEVLAHEFQHVKQFTDSHGFDTKGLGLPGGLAMWGLYITSDEARARYEVEAYRVGLEVHYYRTGQIPTLDQLAAPLRNSYAISPEQAAFAQDLLETATTSVTAGLVSTDVGRVTIDWLKANGL